MRFLFLLSKLICLRRNGKNCNQIFQNILSRHINYLLLSAEENIIIKKEFRIYLVKYIEKKLAISVHFLMQGYIIFSLISQYKNNPMISIMLSKTFVKFYFTIQGISISGLQTVRNGNVQVL